MLAIVCILLMVFVLSTCVCAQDTNIKETNLLTWNGATWQRVTKGQIQGAYIPIVNETTATRTITTADYGKTIICSYAGATTITLPAPSTATVGAVFWVVESVDQSLTITGSIANNNAIIADGVLTSDNVAFSTASHKIGAMARVFGISATKWLITNASSCAMTVEAAD
jgi:hypothetical protein